VTPALLAGVRSLAAEDGITFRVAGVCMAPSLANGTRITVAPARFYWPGDVVAFLSASDRVVAHRVIGYRPTAARLLLWTQADQGAAPDAPVPMERVLGRIMERVTPRQRAAALLRLARHVGSRILASWS
jgi:hypothetical protein